MPFLLLILVCSSPLIIHLFPAKKTQELHTPLRSQNTPSPKRDEALQPQSETDPSPGAGRLSLFFHNWKKVTHNNFILKVIEHGLKLQFHTKPPMSEINSSPFSPLRAASISSEISTLHTKSAIDTANPSDDQFISPIFDVPKKDSKNRRVILNLKILNTYIVKTSFKMEGYDTLFRLIQKNDYFVSIDLKDAYLMFSINSEFWKFLCFKWSGIIYFYKVMPFGLTSAPRIFTKVMKAVLVFLRSRGLRASAWFDDIFIAANSVDLLLEHLYFAKILLKSLGFLINEEKSSLIPSQTIIHLGYIWNSNSLTISVPESKVALLKDQCSKALNRPVSLRKLQRILGTIESFRIAFPFAALHYRYLQREVATCISLGADWDLKISPSAIARKDLLWWIDCPNPLPPRPMSPFIPELQLTTDSSSDGWGAYTSQGIEAYGFWSDEESFLHNNFLETKAVLFAFQSLLRDTYNTSVHIRSDNSTTISYINNQGGVRSEDITEIVSDLYDFCILRNLRIQASFLCGRHNTRADALSRRARVHDYSIPSAFFSSLCNYFNFYPEIDLFASRLNFKVSSYISEGPDPFAFGFDAFTMPWPDSIYAFPPINLVHRFLSHFIYLNVPFGLVIVPFWPAQAFFPTLLDILINNPVIFSASRLENSDMLPRNLSRCLACFISSIPEKRLAFQEQLQFVTSKVLTSEHYVHTAAVGENLPIGVIANRLVIASSI